MSYIAGLTNQVVLPSGRYLTFAWNANNQIASVTDHTGRSVGYAYDASNQLATVTYPDTTTEKYTYDTNGNMLTVVDRRGNTHVTNQYDTNQRVKQQTLADNTTYTFAYTTNGMGAVTATDVANTHGYVEHVTFDSNLMPLTKTKAYGTPLAQTTTFVRNVNELPASITDALSRTSAMTYDSVGDVLTKTYLYGTPNAVTYTYTYTADYHQLATIKDPLGHTSNLWLHEWLSHLDQRRAQSHDHHHLQRIRSAAYNQRCKQPHDNPHVLGDRSARGYRSAEPHHYLLDGQPRPYHRGG